MQVFKPRVVIIHMKAPSVKTEPATHNMHKVGFSQQAQEVIRLSDVILLTLDARGINESRIPELEELIIEQGKKIIHILMKIDLADKNKILASEEIKSLSYPIFISTKTKEGIAALRERIHILAKKVKDHPIANIGVIGYPNTGKSSLLSLLARRAAAPVSAHSGFTKGIRKVRFAKGIILLDSPGVIRKDENLFENKNQKKHALLGVHTPENVKNPDMIVVELMRMHPDKLEKFYKIEANGDTEILLEELGIRWNILKKKGQIDIDKVARRVLKDWHLGHLK